MDRDLQFAALRGCMKSGTNWVGEILEAHPEVCCRGEYHWQKLYSKVEAFFASNASHPSCAALDNGSLGKGFSRFIKELMVHGGAPVPAEARWLVDRTPWEVTPDFFEGPIFYILRDGRSVVVSRVFHILNRRISSLIEQQPFKELLAVFEKDSECFEKHPELLLENEWVLQDSSVYWSRQVQRDLDWIAAHPSRPVLVVRYEDLWSDFAAQTERMFSFLGLAALPDQCVSQRILPGISNPSPTAFRRSGTTNNWQRYFCSDAINAAFRRHAGASMERAGYDLNGDTMPGLPGIAVDLDREITLTLENPSQWCEIQDSGSAKIHGSAPGHPPSELCIDLPASCQSLALHCALLHPQPNPLTLHISIETAGTTRQQEADLSAKQPSRTVTLGLNGASMVRVKIVCEDYQRTGCSIQLTPAE